MNILIFTRSEDNASVAMVTSELTKRGATVVRFDTDLYPQDIQVRSSYLGETQKIAVKTPSGLLDLYTVDSVWYRRFSAGNRLPETLGDTLPAEMSRDCLFTGRSCLWTAFTSTRYLKSGVPTTKSFSCAKPCAWGWKFRPP